MTYTLSEINKQAKMDPKGFIERSEAAYHGRIGYAVDTLMPHIQQRPIILINGPSSAGKTTTAQLVSKAFAAHGIESVVISMDDYYKTRRLHAIPKDEDGMEDLESPLCMDLPLLGEHLQMLAEGVEIEVPQFDFAQQSRTEQVTTLQLKSDQIAVIEGIHSLNDMVTDKLGEKANCLYLNVEGQIALPNDGVLPPELLRFMRRAVRDRNFRGEPIPQTIQRWRSVRRGEQLYIAPYLHHVTLSIDTYLPYESCILMNQMQEDITQNKDALYAAGLTSIYAANGCFAEMEYAQYLPKNSIIHEFIR